jgi:hypothetical protein
MVNLSREDASKLLEQSTGHYQPLQPGEPDQPIPPAVEEACEICNGAGTIDETLGGYSFNNPAAECPGCEGSGCVSTPPAEGEVGTAMLGKQLTSLATRLMDKSTPMNPEVAIAVGDTWDLYEDAPKPVAPPAEGEVAELVEWLGQLSEMACSTDEASQLDRVIALLSQRSPQPVAWRRLMSVDTTTREALRLANALETLAEDHDQGSLEERTLEAAAGLLRRLAAKPQPSSGEVEG